jgi:hypothetical protein
MKSNVKIFALAFTLIITSLILPKKALAQQGNVSFQLFYDQLSPYGQWVNYSNYGYVWVPNAGADFVPYSTGGHWILTEYGWTWVSDYNWGWAPFHYGRWNFDNSYGWLWIPDNEWGPAWVTWRRADGYYGWQPMEPGISVNLSFGRPYSRSYDHWMFVRDRDFERSDINHYYVGKTDHDRIIKNSTVINKTYIDNKRRTTYVSGPAREDVQKVTGKKINPVVIQENNKPGQTLSNGQLHIYRPLVSNNNAQLKKPVPARISNLKDIRKVSGSNTQVQTKSVNPASAKKQERQPISASPSKNYEKKAQVKKPSTVVASINSSKKAQVAKQKNLKPFVNTQQHQANNVKPSTNIQQPKVSNVKPSVNTQQRQVNNAKPSVNPPQHQPNNVRPSANTQQRQAANIKPSNEMNREQPKESRPENERK